MFLGWVNLASWLPLAAGREFTQPSKNVVDLLCPIFSPVAEKVVRDGERPFLQLRFCFCINIALNKYRK